VWLDFDDLSSVWRVDHQSSADVEPYVADLDVGVAVEHKVTW
jgi:hypothetical protein